MAILVTGGAGFIGSNFIHEWFSQTDETLVNLDALTYAGNLQNLSTLSAEHAYHFVKANIADYDSVTDILTKYQPRAVLHFAAESHVDRAILGPNAFVQTNVMGTFQLLEAVRNYWQNTKGQTQEFFRFVNVSTDEVFGTLGAQDRAFTEDSAYQPNSPYSATKAGADHLVRAYHHTYGLPTLTTHCSNNYGPYQFPEKLIPLMIHNALTGRPLPVYGDGKHIRDWLYVRDHCRALLAVLKGGKPGESFVIGGKCEKANIEVVETLCETLTLMHPPTVAGKNARYSDLITFVTDRPGHDRRYAINAEKIQAELGWSPQESFETGMEKTIRWYLTHPDWVRNVTSGAYREWVQRQYS